MKKLLTRITLAAATILLLGSCAKINERLDNLDKRLSLLGSDGIATISTQIESINSSIADLGTIRTNIQNLTSTTAAQAQDIADLNNEDTEIGKKISDLKKADESINARIDNLQKYVNDTLKSYATTEWVNATFSTLAQYEATCDTIAKIDARIGSMDTRLSKSIEDCADSLKSWVNVQLDGYYTIAQMDAKVTEMKAQLDTLSGESATAADSLKAEIATAKAEIDTVKANIRTEYKSAIETAITELDGKLNNKLQKQIINVTSQIYSLEPKITELENKYSALKTRIDALESMIQSVTIIPAYNDGSVEGFGSILKIKCVVEPADAVAEITKDDIIVLISEAITKAVKFDTVAVSKLELDKTTGEINIKADISSIPPVPDGKTLMAALEITIGPSNYITGFYPIYSGANVIVTTGGDDSPEINIKADPDFPDAVSGEIPVEDFFKEAKSTTIKVEGIGTVTFDKDAAAKIKENASGATNITIKVEDITETFANPVPDADVVLEVTMKAVDEAGTEVFSESNASGTVTIEIPVDPEVVFVKNVTLVDDDGVVIENGVDPETIKLDLEKHLLSFEVKHFSKYAVGYVKKDDFVSVTGVTLDTNKLTIAVGGTETLTATIDPNDATNKKVTWSSNNTNVATVDKDGNVKAITKGEAIITVTTEDGSKTATCTVTVVVPVTGVSLDSTSLTLAVGVSKTLAATVAPDNATNNKVKWSSDNTTVATVGDDGKVTAKAVGTANIIVTTEDIVRATNKPASDTCVVTVVVPVTEVSLNSTSLTLAVGGSETLTATVTPNDATNKNVTWSSSDTTKVKVDNTGKITAVAWSNNNPVTITVTTVDGGKTATCKVTVKETKTMAELLATNVDIPKAADLTPPSNAWQNSKNPNCKAFVGYDGEDIIFTAWKSIPDVGGNKIVNFGLLMTDEFDRTGEDIYTHQEEIMTAIATMEDGKFTSCEFTIELDGYECLNGTYKSLLPAGALAGEFSVSNDGGKTIKKVHFSQGNLTYDVMDKKWAFYGHQYDRAEAYDANLISFFTWGYGSWSSSPSGYKYQTSDFTDWGSQIGDGNTWHTLTIDEWQYLFENHNKKYITVCGRKGYAIAPDGVSADAISETYKTDADWKAAQDAGIVFLPAAGYRNLSNLHNVGTNGQYWSSSGFDGIYAHFVFFGATTLRYKDGSSRETGFSVRLVTDAPDSNGTEQYNNNSNPDWFSK